MPLDLLHTAPQRLADEALEDLDAAVQAVADWTPRHGEVVEWVMRHVVLRLLTRSHTAGELERLHEHLARLFPPRRHAEIDAAAPGLRDTIATYARLLDTRLAILDAQAPEAVLAMAHARDILRVVAEHADGVMQSELGETVRLKKANLTRILNRMEHNELVVRVREGRDNRVRLGAKAPRPAQSDAPVTQPAAAIRGPKRYLSGATA